MDGLQEKNKASAILNEMTTSIKEKKNSRHLNNIYFHLTYRCNLKCTHCYSNGDLYSSSKNISKKVLLKGIKEAEMYAFRQIVITGGEPSVHPQFYKIVDTLRKKRKVGSILVLRTNLVGEYTDRQLRVQADVFDKIFVSVDGDEEQHDQRRGKGAYKKTVFNVKRLSKIIESYKDTTELILACVMDKESIQNRGGDSVRQLSRDMGCRDVRFRPVLPIGRASLWELPPRPEALGSYIPAEKVLEQGIEPKVSCGIGKNLYVAPNGDIFPCYALTNENNVMGNIKDGLFQILQSEESKNQINSNVDTIQECKNCEYRYLCGGACRSWANKKDSLKKQKEEFSCLALEKRCRDMVSSAEQYFLSSTL